MSGGDVTLGVQTRMLFSETTARRHQYTSYTGSADLEIEIGDITNWATDSLYFAGNTFTAYPYVPMSRELSTAYLALNTNLTIEYDAYPGDGMITVLNHAIGWGLAAEDVAAGQPVMLADTADHATDKHDGMYGVTDLSTAAEMYAIVGIARTAADAAASHDNHSFDIDDLENSSPQKHPEFEILFWR